MTDTILLLAFPEPDGSLSRQTLEALSLVCKGAESPCDQEVDVTLVQLTVQCFRICGHEMKHDARMAPGEPIDDGGNEAHGPKGVASNPHFPGRRVGEKLDVLHRLA